MPPITMPAERVIIGDFAEEIRKRKTQTVKPSKIVIDFRTEKRDGVEREVFRVPIELLRFRKDNGRISSDVTDYEKNVGPLDESNDGHQAIVGEYLAEKDPEKSAILRKSIIHSGQDRPAIITCDGFLIDGNRRKLVLEKLHREFPEEPSYAYMKVVILPGPDDEGGPPTLYDIEKLENRYQLQSDGKSEYYGFDRALSIKRKIKIGFTLEEQLRDDPRYAEASAAEIEKAKREVEKKYLKPLECADRYLAQFRRSGQYRTISKGMSDPEGRWQALVDYSESYARYFSSPKKLAELGIEEDEVGAIEEAAFDIVRLRTIPEMPKVHLIMRSLPKYCGTPKGKSEILKIPEEVEPTLPPSECRGDDGAPLSPEEIDARWASKAKRAITHRLKKASQRHDLQRDRETPLSLLEAAHKKLTHRDMDIKSINMADIHRARELVVAIKERADELEGDIYRCEKSLKSLMAKGRAK
ncbi:MAG: hypothetical protein KY475_06400 [Planctomycetes bacterium]|nr:hypothetical protein [Planctomycetota bacterium]